MGLNVRPSFEEFARLARGSNLIPIATEVVADAVTPVGLLASGWNESEHCFLLESVEGGERLGRYSIVSFEPRITLSQQNGKVTIRGVDGKTRETRDKSAVDALARYMRSFRAADVPGLPRFFGGAVGYLSYEMVHQFEKLPMKNPDHLGWPQASFMIGGDLFIFDHTRQLLSVVTCVEVDRPSEARRAYQAGCRRLEKSLQRLRRPAMPASKNGSRARAEANFHSNVTREAFMASVRKAKEFIGKGDIFQVVLSRRQEKRSSASPLDIYRCLRVVNPSPYMYLMKMGDRAIVGSSPESLVRLEQGVAMTRPIAGTRRRGGTEQKDVALEKSLMADPKERAEHIMLVDLGRNDLGRVCRYGSVKVPDFMTVERYSHVMHIVSEVVGQIRPGKDAFDLLRSVFPAGTVSGAPKIRAMEIIDELETTQRGPYAGAIGYFSYSGNMDVAITIRTLLWDRGRVSIQTGAGLVADSDPATEWDETENKAAGMKRTVELAESGALFGVRR
ncbi:MAG: anthranilate synthase component I [Elusimicrobia bacterium]|nr:anthranilate synthase component I [Elusimicrobiota bacterium]